MVKNNKMRNKFESKKYTFSSSSSSSSDSSSPSIELRKKRKYKKKHTSISSSSSISSNSSSDNTKFKHTYKVLKHRLLKDQDFCPIKCDAYGSIYSTGQQNVSIGDPIIFEKNQTLLNIDHVAGSSDIIVRRPGVYYILASIFSDQPLQIAYYINGSILHTTILGKNSGAGPLISKHFFTLNDGDIITIRNYGSLGAFTIPAGTGGLIESTNAEIVLQKISPNIENMKKSEKIVAHIAEKHKNIYKRKQHLFEEIKEKMKSDSELCINIEHETFGCFWRSNPQTIDVEKAIIFDNHQNLKNVEHTLGTSDVIVKKSGMYMLVFQIGTTKASQWTVFINGIANNTTTGGINKGAGQLLLRQTLSLNEKDVISIRNHTSAVGSVDISQNAGGKETGNDAIFILYRISMLESELNKLSCYNRKIYEYIDDEIDSGSGSDSDNDSDSGSDNLEYKLFKHYLFKNKFNLTITGLLSYGKLFGQDPQTINVDAPVIFYEKQNIYNLAFISGKAEVMILIDGVYKIIFDSETTTPVQWTVSVNSIPNTTTTCGNDSGAGQSLLRQVLNLKKGDILTIINHTSFMGSVELVQTAGGTEPSNNISFGLLRLGALETS